jgi:hypothetical protein
MKSFMPDQSTLGIGVIDARIIVGVGLQLEKAGLEQLGIDGALIEG